MLSRRWILRSFKAPVLITTGVAICLAVARCSPISPSVSKFRTASTPSSPRGSEISRESPTSPASTGSIGPSTLTLAEPQQPVTQQSEPPRPQAQSQGVAARVLDFANYESTIESLPATQRVTLSPADSSLREIFESFKEKRELTLNFAGTLPEECRAYFGLALSETALEALGLGPILIECQPVTETSWRFSIASSVSTEDWQHIRDALQSITLFVSNRPEMTISAAETQAPQPTSSEPCPHRAEARSRCGE